ncbi:MAG: helix-turn-helix domain-containing protein [Thermoprotei archaeon]
MNRSESPLNVLMELGLSRYEAQVCVSLYTHGALTSGEIAEYSGVPRSWIYTVLKSLRDKGWIENTNTRPRLFKPIRINSILPRLRRELLENVHAKLNLLEELGSGKVESSEAISAIVYYGEKQVASKASQLALNSRDFTLVLTPSWLRRLNTAKAKRVLVSQKNHNLIIMDDAVFWFPDKTDFPTLGVLAYSKSLARRLTRFVEEKERAGEWRKPRGETGRTEERSNHL